jgi:cytochrome c-type biogenesis protein CcmH/NrfG
MSYTDEDIAAMVNNLKENPQDSSQWHTLGVALLSVRQIDAAEDAFRECLRFDKDNELALGDLGALMVLRGKQKEAVGYLEKSLKLNPSNHEYWCTLGIAQLQRNKYKPAVEAFQRCLQVEPDYFDAVISLGLTYYRMEDWQKAVGYLVLALERDPENYDALKALARSQNRLNRTDDLIKTYNRML